MSGLEILGIAANVIQIADLGARLSVKLFAFSRKVKNAKRSIEAISKDIAATGAVLQQLGTQLNKDQNARLCSDEAATTAREFVADCQRLFQDIERAIEPIKPGQKATWLQRAKYPFLDTHVDSLRCNLDRLKSSLMLMLNTLILVGQMRSHEALQTLSDQRELILLLLGDARDSNEMCERSEQLVKECQPDLDTESGAAKHDYLDPATSLSVSMRCREFEYSDESVPQSNSTKETAETAQSRNGIAASGFEIHKQEMLHHCALVGRLLVEIEASKYEIDQSVRGGMCRIVLEFHWNHWLSLREIYGLHALMEAMSHDHSEIAEFWVSQHEKLARGSSRAGNHAYHRHGCEKASERLDLVHRCQEQQNLKTQHDGRDTRQRPSNQVRLASDRMSGTKDSPHFLGFSTPSIANPPGQKDNLFQHDTYAFHHAGSQLTHTFVPTQAPSEAAAWYASSQLACAYNLSYLVHLSSFCNVLVDRDAQIDQGQTPAELRLHGANVSEPPTVEALHSFQDATRLPAQLEGETDIVDQLILQYTILTEADIRHLNASIRASSDTDLKQERLQQPLVPRDESAGLANTTNKELVAYDELEESLPPQECLPEIATDLRSQVVYADVPPDPPDPTARKSSQDIPDGRLLLVEAPFQSRTKRRRHSLESTGSVHQQGDHYSITRHATMIAEHALAHEKSVAGREDIAKEERLREWEAEVRPKVEGEVGTSRPKKRRQSSAD